MSTEPDVMVVDDDEDFREATYELLVDTGIKVEKFAYADPMLAALDPEWPGVVLCDVRMAGRDGFQALKAARERAPDVPFIMITGYGDVRMAVSAIRAGAFDFVEKTAQPEFIKSAIDRALVARRMQLENRKLRMRVSRRGGMRSRFLGRSAAIKRARKLMHDLAQLPITVLVTGEPGTGKSLAAETMHEFGSGPGDFRTVSCLTANPQSFAEEITAFEPASTVLFRNVDRLRPDVQEQLVEFLHRDRRPRAILSANDKQSLLDALYYMASGAVIELPPLADRRQDIFILFEHFVREAAARYGKRLPMVTKELLKPFSRHPWRGNARELRTVAERMVLGLPPGLETRGATDTGSLTYDAAMAEFERNLLDQALRETGGRKGDAATLLSIPRKRLYLRMKAVGLLKSGQE